MKYIIRNLCIISTGILLICCSEPFDPNINSSPSQVVINGILYPDSSIGFRVDQNSSNGLLDPLERALLTINGVRDSTLSYSLPFFSSDMLGVSGSKYELELVFSSGVEIRTSTIMPSPVHIDSAYVQVSGGYFEDESFSGAHPSITLNFIDPVGEENFYEIIVYQKTFTTVFEEDTTYDQHYFRILETWSDHELIVRNGLEGSGKYYSQLFNDSGHDGQELALKLNTLNTDLIFDSETYVVLNSLTKEYFEFKRSMVNQLWALQRLDDISNFDIVNPRFFRPIGPVYGNIDGGLGVFAGISFTQKKCAILP